MTTRNIARSKLLKHNKRSPYDTAWVTGTAHCH